MGYDDDASMQTGDDEFDDDDDDVYDDEAYGDGGDALHAGGYDDGSPTYYHIAGNSLLPR